MRSLNHLLHACDEVFGAYRFRFGRRSAGMSQIVNPFQDDHIFDARLSENVAIESRQGIDAEPNICGGIVQNPVPPDSGVEHPDLPAAAARE